MAFVTATFNRLEQNADGTATMVFRYTGDAGEIPVESKHTINTSVMPTADWSRGLAMAQLAVLNTNKSFVAGALSAVGTVLDTTTALPTAPASTFGQFCAASAPFTPGATPQDVFAITGSATRTVQVMRMGISTVQTTAGVNAFLLVKRSTANSGGTSALVAGVPSDDSYPAATATVRQYTSNPTAGTLIGSVWSGRVASPAPATAFAGPLERAVEQSRGGPIATLTGTTDVLSWNLNGVTLPTGLSVQASVWWTENAP